MEQLNGFELAGRPMKVGNVTERTDGGSSSRFDADELDRAGVDLGATGRLQLMFKLAEGTGLQVRLLQTFIFHNLSNKKEVIQTKILFFYEVV